jgi:hypothetical protein
MRRRDFWRRKETIGFDFSIPPLQILAMRELKTPIRQPGENTI